MNKIKAVLFDLDGVICNTDHYHYLAWKALADKLNIPFDEAVNAKLGIKPEEALVIEDATSGIQAAYSGGFRATGLCSEKNQPDSDITIRRLTSLLDIL